MILFFVTVHLVMLLSLQSVNHFYLDNYSIFFPGLDNKTQP